MTAWRVCYVLLFFFFQAEDGIRDYKVTGVQTCALPISLPAQASLAEAADRVAAAGRSRYPVTGESLDDVIGIVHAKDILRGLLSGAEAPVQDIARPAFFVPGTREVEDVLADMKRQKVHLAIVLDEFGGTAG